MNTHELAMQIVGTLFPAIDIRESIRTPPPPDVELDRLATEALQRGECKSTVDLLTELRVDAVHKIITAALASPPPPRTITEGEADGPL